VGLDAVPQEDDAASDMTSQMAEEPQDGWGTDRSGLELKKHSCPAAIS
jgi:hypothetical protein